MTAHELADAEHVVYAGMRDIGDRNAAAAAEATRYADEHGVALRPIEMDVSDETSVEAAAAAVFGEQAVSMCVSTTLAIWCSDPTELSRPNRLHRSTTRMCCPPSGLTAPCSRHACPT